MEGERAAGVAGAATPRWWVPAYAPAPALTPSATGAAPLPADVALWLTELRHASDTDDLPWVLRAVSAPAADPPSGAEAREDAEEGGSALPDVSANRDDSVVAADHCAAHRRRVCAPTDTTLVPSGPARPEGGSCTSVREAACCVPNCPDWREPRLGKLCQNAIDELRSVLLKPGAEGCEVGAGAPAQCEVAGPVATSAVPPLPPRCALPVPPVPPRNSALARLLESGPAGKTVFSPVTAAPSVERGRYSQQPDPSSPGGADEKCRRWKAETAAEGVASEGLARAGPAPEAPSPAKGGSAAPFCDGRRPSLGEGACIDDPGDAQEAFPAESQPQAEHGSWRGCEMMCCVDDTERSESAESEFSFSLLESILPRVQGMEDVQKCEVDTLKKEYSDFYSLCDDTSSLIEETLQYFTEQPSCRVLKTQQSQSTIASSLSDDVFTSRERLTEVEEEYSNTSIHEPSQSMTSVESCNVNSIFDDGRCVPVAPPRLNKMRRLKLTSSSSSRSATENFEVVTPPSQNSASLDRNVSQEQSKRMLYAGHNLARERKTRSFFSEHNSFSVSAGLSTSLQNLSLPDGDNANTFTIIQQGTKIFADDTVPCESGSDSSLLEVNIPTLKPVSSFVFPANVEMSPPSPSASKSSLRYISSMENFSSSMCDSLLLERPRKGSGSSDIAAWKRDLQRSPFFSQDDDYLPAEEWFSSTDGKGRVYFFEENSNVSSWTLPNIVVANEEATSENDPQIDPSNLPLRNQDGEKKSRIGKARSMFLSDQKHKETTSKSSSIPRNWLQLYGLDKDVLKYGYMNRTKITENGKKMSKKWASAYVVLTDDTLCFYKDLKNSQHSVGLQPELSMQLSGARVESGEKLSSRKHIFLITSGSLQLLCECEVAELAQWRAAISNAIARLNKPVVTPTIKISHDKPKTASIIRSKSLQVKNREGTFDDGVTSEEQQMKIRDRLKKFFNRRPTREILASKGIYKDEPVFDSHLEKVCPSYPPFIPDFVKLCVAAIESKEENMKTDGLYRASGNLSHVQKIRLQVDQNNLSVLEAEEDVHVLTGALKLFFRELKEPLIPYELFNEAIDAGGMNASKKDKTKMFRDIVKKLPQPNHDTLKFLLQHLRRVTSFEEHNRMHVPNLAIVFGPTLMWREKEYHQNMAIEYMQQNLVIEFLLQQFDEIFR